MAYFVSRHARAAYVEGELIATPLRYARGVPGEDFKNGTLDFDVKINRILYDAFVLILKVNKFHFMQKTHKIL